MPDITMCSNYKCPIRWHCYRSASSGTEPSDRRQSYSRFEPKPAEGNASLIKCDHFVLTDHEESK